MTAHKLTLVGGTDGLVTAGGTSGIAVNDLPTDGVGNDAVRSLRPGMQITGGQIRGGAGPDTGGGQADLDAGDRCGGLQVRAGCAATDSIMLDTVGVDTVSVGVEPQPEAWSHCATPRSMRCRRYGERSPLPASTIAACRR